MFQFDPTQLGGIPVLHYYWDFGDGTVNTVETNTITHVYDSPGEYSVLLRIYTETGGFDVVDTVQVE